MIVSLTSVPSRFSTLQRTLSSLTSQGVDTVWLWVPENYARFPDWDGSLPDIPQGVTLKRCSRDFGPATKFAPALEECPKDTQILICDDDVAYHPGWAEAFLTASKMRPDCAIAASTFEVGRLGLNKAQPADLVAQGFAGILFRPEMLGGQSITGRDYFADDIWISAALAASGCAIHIAPELRGLSNTFDSPTPLQDAYLNGMGRAETYKKTAVALAEEMRIWGHG